MLNPYWDKTFFGFCRLFAIRLMQFIRNDLSLSDLATDEIQVAILILISFSSALLGSFLVIKKMTMLANSLSHTVLLGIVCAFVLIRSKNEYFVEISLNFEILLLAAILSGFITTLLIQLLTHIVKLKEDASTGLVFTTLFALGVVLASTLTRSSHIGIEAVMGHIDALHFSDLKLVFFVALLNTLIFGLFFNQFKMTSFDPLLSKNLGVSPHFFNYLLMILVSMTVIASFRAVGVLLVLAFLVGPVLFAQLFTKKLLNLILIACSTAICISFVGVALSRHCLSVYNLAISTSGLIASLIGLVYFIAAILKRGSRVVFRR
ncbi:MAG: metal ABC transporter permease [Rhabdochlamydiaceae bacterium]